MERPVCWFLRVMPEHSQRLWKGCSVSLASVRAWALPRDAALRQTFPCAGMRARIWIAGFDSASADGISVPEPIGVIPRFRMWFQRKVPGETATRLLGGSDGVELAQRIAAAIHKLHRANVPTERQHGMADE